jgi:hopanoid-associated phosphorylase
MSAGRLGVLVGLLAEAKLIRAAMGDTALVMCSGGRPERAAALAEELVGRGVSALLSFGLAGGIAPDLQSGTGLLPGAVRLPDGETVSVTPGWRESWLRACPELRGGTLLGSDGPVTDVMTKRRLFESLGVVAVDMESHCLARVARAAGLPFLVLRAIADPADRAIPPAALAGLAEDGRTRPLAVLAGLCRHPGDFTAILRLGRDAAAATATLKRVVGNHAHLLEPAAIDG